LRHTRSKVEKKIVRIWIRVKLSWWYVLSREAQPHYDSVQL